MHDRDVCLLRYTPYNKKEAIGQIYLAVNSWIATQRQQDGTSIGTCGCTLRDTMSCGQTI